MRGDYQYLTITNEESQTFSGIVKGGLLSKPYANSKVTIISTNTSFYDIAETDEKGHFEFKDFEFPDSTSYIIQALNVKGKDIVELYIDSITFPTVSSTGIYSGKQTEEIEKPEFKEYVEKADLKYTYENGMRMRILPELVVKAHHNGRQHQSFYYNDPDNSMSAEEIKRSAAGDMRSLLNRVPGVNVTFNTVRFRMLTKKGYRENLNPPMIIVDGMMLSYGDDDPESQKYVGDLEAMNVLSLLDIDDIAQVDIIKSPAKLHMYGSRGRNGVIEIFTKSGFKSNKPQFNTQQIKPLGYQQPVEFYSPQYDTPEAKNSVTPDLRSTIYWKPDVWVDSEGNASVDFYTADSPSTYSVIIEGITPEGKLIYYQGKSVVSVETN
ncbi:hypothetical protein FACS189440_21500 [Bacteroidia bacterium]|nr:hypothetical protein FACS189440_21500 [Bacteroidia bacterium]